MKWLILCMGLFLAACASPTTVPTAVPSVPTELVPPTPGTETVQLPTLLPTVVVPATQALPTATPLIPTVTPIMVTATAPAPTRPPPTQVPAETATPLPEGVPRVYVTAMRVEPTSPKADTPGTFFVTFQNNSGENLAHRWAVETWRAEEQKPFGLTSPQNSPMPVGEFSLPSTGWAPRGQGECVFYRAKVVALDEGGNRSDFIRPDGSILWLDFTVCP